MNLHENVNQDCQAGGDSESWNCPWWLSGKEAACNAGDMGSIPGLRRFPENDNPLQYSCLENPNGQRRLVGCSLWGCKDSYMT